MFRATSRLLECRITFFTRNPCGLCDTAKAVVQNVKAQRSFQYREINVMEAGQEEWKSVYEFDTPVVCFQAIKYEVWRRST
jgi:glutaredoxin